MHKQFPNTHTHSLREPRLLSYSGAGGEYIPENYQAPEGADRSDFEQQNLIDPLHQMAYDKVHYLRDEFANLDADQQQELYDLRSIAHDRILHRVDTQDLDTNMEQLAAFKQDVQLFLERLDALVEAREQVQRSDYFTDIDQHFVASVENMGVTPDHENASWDIETNTDDASDDPGWSPPELADRIAGPEDSDSQIASYAREQNVGAEPDIPPDEYENYPPGHPLATPESPWLSESEAIAHMERVAGPNGELVTAAMAELGFENIRVSHEGPGMIRWHLTENFFPYVLVEGKEKHDNILAYYPDGLRSGSHVPTVLKLQGIIADDVEHNRVETSVPGKIPDDIALFMRQTPYGQEWLKEGKTVQSVHAERHGQWLSEQTNSLYMTGQMLRQAETVARERGAEWPVIARIGALRAQIEREYAVLDEQADTVERRLEEKYNFDSVNDSTLGSMILGTKEYYEGGYPAYLAHLKEQRAAALADPEFQDPWLQTRIDATFRFPISEYTRLANLPEETNYGYPIPVEHVAHVNDGPEVVDGEPLLIDTYWREEMKLDVVENELLSLADGETREVQTDDPDKPRRYMRVGDRLLYQTKKYSGEDGNGNDTYEYRAVWGDVSTNRAVIQVDGEYRVAEEYADGPMMPLNVVDGRAFDQYGEEAQLNAASGLYEIGDSRYAVGTDGSWHTAYERNGRIGWPSVIQFSGHGPTIEIDTGDVTTEVAILDGDIVGQSMEGSIWNPEAERGEIDSEVQFARAIAPKFKIAYEAYKEEDFETGYNMLKAAKQLMESNGRELYPKYMSWMMEFAAKVDRHDVAADTAYEMSLREPDNATYKNEYAWYTINMENPGSPGLSVALREVNKALALSPDDPQYLDTQAAVYARMGDFDKAVSIQKRAIDLAPDDESLHSDDRKEFQQRLEQYTQGIDPFAPEGSQSVEQGNEPNDNEYADLPEAEYAMPPSAPEQAEDTLSPLDRLVGPNGSKLHAAFAKVGFINAERTIEGSTWKYEYRSEQYPTHIVKVSVNPGASFMRFRAGTEKDGVPGKGQHWGETVEELMDRLPGLRPVQEAVEISEQLFPIGGGLDLHVTSEDYNRLRSAETAGYSFARMSVSPGLVSVKIGLPSGEVRTVGVERNAYLDNPRELTAKILNVVGLPNASEATQESAETSDGVSFADFGIEKFNNYILRPDVAAKAYKAQLDHGLVLKDGGSKSFDVEVYAHDTLVGSVVLYMRPTDVWNDKLSALLDTVLAG